MAYSVLVDPKDSPVAYARVGSDDVYAYAKNDIIYVRVNTGTFTAVKTIVPEAPLDNYLPSNNKTRIHIHPNGYIVYIGKMYLAGAQGFHLEVVHYTGTPALVSQTIEALINDTIMVGASGIGSIFYQASGLIHVMWNGYFRSMGSNFYSIKHLTVAVPSGVVSATTQILDSATAITGQAVMPNVAENALILKYSDGAGYIPLGSLTITNTHINGIFFTDAYLHEKYIVKQGAANVEGIYFAHLYTNGSNTWVRMVTATSRVDATTTEVCNQSITNGFKTVSAGCHTSADGNTLYVYGILQSAATASIKRYRVYSFDISIAITTSRTPTLEIDEPFTEFPNVFTDSFPSWGGLFMPPNVGLNATDVEIFVFDSGSNGNIYYTTRVSAVSIDLALAIGTSGGRAIAIQLSPNKSVLLTTSLSSTGGRAFAINIGVPSVEEILTLFTFSHISTPVKIRVGEANYSFSLGGISYPTQWVTIRKWLNQNGEIVSTLTCLMQIPVGLDVVPDTIEMFMKHGLVTRLIIEGLTTSQTNRLDGTLVEAVLAIRSKRYLTTPKIKAVSQRVDNNNQSYRLPPDITLDPGDTVDSTRGFINVASVTTYISTDQSFTEVREA